MGDQGVEEVHRRAEGVGRTTAKAKANAGVAKIAESRDIRACFPFVQAGVDRAVEVDEEIGCSAFGCFGKSLRANEHSLLAGNIVDEAVKLFYAFHIDGAGVVLTVDNDADVVLPDFLLDEDVDLAVSPAAPAWQSDVVADNRVGSELPLD